jgi:hypothetical protein
MATATTTTTTTTTTMTTTTTRGFAVDGHDGRRHGGSRPHPGEEGSTQQQFGIP